MRYLFGISLLVVYVMLVSCATTNERGTLAELRHVNMILEDATVDNGLEKAMDSYRKFLKETPKSAMTPEAMRRIADLSIEKEYGYIDDAKPAGKTEKTELEKPEMATVAVKEGNKEESKAPHRIEGDKEFEERATRQQVLAPKPTPGLKNNPAAASDLENADARKAIALYKKLLKEYPLYERNDQVLYQMSRAYEELGETEKAMEVMNRFVKTYQNSRYLDEIQFRRAEYLFTRKKYMDAEDAYKSIVSMGKVSSYYELALYKLGWSFYKQQLYEEALSQFIALLDYKVSTGYDFDQPTDSINGKRVEDTYRVISLSFSNMGGPDVVVDFFSRIGERDYEDKIYKNLGEFYLGKRRYADAANTYKAFIKVHPFHKESPQFAVRTIDVYKAGHFGRLVIEAKKEFAQTYALDAEYWQHFDINSRPEVVGHLKANLKDLATYYHSRYQDKRFAKEKQSNYAEALVWYRKYLASFPQDKETPPINYQMAELMLENHAYGDAATAYEYTAYNYPKHDKSSAAGYAAVYAYREELKIVKGQARVQVKQEIIRSSLRFADTFPKHKKVAVVLGAAADDLYEMKNYPLAISTAHKLLDNYPQTEQAIRRSAWLVVGHSSFAMAKFADAEQGYKHVLQLTDEKDKTRKDVINNLAASIYKQGEEANKAGNYRVAANHFLRVRTLAPTSKITPKAEFDAATALIKLKDWPKATEVLLGFRKYYPDNSLQPEVTKKIAYVYKSDGKIEMAAAEYERMAAESKDEQVRRGSLELAADLYGQAGNKARQLVVYNRFVTYFPAPAEEALEIYNKMAKVYQETGQNALQTEVLRKIVAIDRTAGKGRTDRTRYLAAEAALQLAKPQFDQFIGVSIVEPIKANLERKKTLMKHALDAYGSLVDYEVADVTSAATYYMAEIYYNFSRSLMSSERPKNLSAAELEQYNLMLEDQSYPFEEKSINVHRKNIELLHKGIYNQWIEKSIAKLAKTYPALYARKEEHAGFVETIDTFHYSVNSGSDGIQKKKDINTTESDQNVSRKNELDNGIKGSTQETLHKIDVPVVSQKEKPLANIY